MRYRAKVESLYAAVNEMIIEKPHLKEIDSDHAIKNFGLSKWNANAGGLEEDEEMQIEDQLGIFDGTVEDLKKETRAKFMEGM